MDLAVFPAVGNRKPVAFGGGYSNGMLLVFLFRLCFVGKIYVGNLFGHVLALLR